MDWGSCVFKTADGTEIATLGCLPIVIKNVINWALIFAGVVALVLIIYAGFKFVTSKGDPQGVDDAKKTLTYAIIGLIVILFSFAILNLISTVTGVGQITNPTF